MKIAVIVTSHNLDTISMVNAQTIQGSYLVTNQHNQELADFLPASLAELGKVEVKPEIIVILNERDRFATPKSLERIHRAFEENEYISAVYSDSYELVDDFLIERYLPGFHQKIATVIDINTPIAFKMDVSRYIPRAEDGFYANLLKGITQSYIAHHIAEPLFICQH